MMNTPRTENRPLAPRMAPRMAMSALILTLAAGCSTTPRTTAQPHAPAPQRPAQPERGSAREPVAAINRGLGTGETLWHLRSALNVAALSCRQKSENQIASNYNRILRLHRAALADAYAEEQTQYRQRYGNGWQGRQDRHLTSLYNYFANPVAMRPFCAAALDISRQMLTWTPAQVRDYARPALAQLERPLVAATSLSRR